MLRLDWNLLFNMINLIILYYLMKRFLFKPINAILERRQQEADEQFAKADQKMTEAKACKEEYDALLADAEGEKEKLLQEARMKASTEQERIVLQAQEKAEQIVEKAKCDAGAEKDAIMQKADEEVREMVLTAAARIAAKKNSEENDRALYEKFLSEAE